MTPCGPFVDGVCQKCGFADRLDLLDYEDAQDALAVPPVGSSENLNVLPGGFFDNLLRSDESDARGSS